MQMTFLRDTLGLHANGSGVADEVVRAEVGCERLQDRWAKLKLGYWRRLFSAPADRLLRVVAEFRWRERVHPGGNGYWSSGWMPTAEAALERVGLLEYWHMPGLAVDMTPNVWRSAVYESVDAASNCEREARIAVLPSTKNYAKIKEWEANPTAYSFSSGEDDRLCQHVPERYLDDRKDLKGNATEDAVQDGLPACDGQGRA